MSFELMPGLAPWVALVLVVAAIAVVGIVVAAVELVGDARQDRLTRGETKRAYYGHRLAFSH